MGRNPRYKNEICDGLQGSAFQEILAKSPVRLINTTVQHGGQNGRTGQPAVRQEVLGHVIGEDVGASSSACPLRVPGPSNGAVHVIPA
ncbi:hypothetical protein Ppa06_14940 [Planomonospora parontospora subsp. parontospora]|uniref:Uncharacterized protein n=2 Tax=Planomonospora parontospora TaxID=58119 RepID=A0AA37F348_9ACTN|nr:hypothetical protein GCM10010126_15490 [Planomonospora parontospora]GII07696.1 hypothetical protein Ppa06_14940 [Planomonospora parontospora subsp. parontospora]